METEEFKVSCEEVDQLEVACEQDNREYLAMILQDQSYLDDDV